MTVLRAIGQGRQLSEPAPAKAGVAVSLLLGTERGSLPIDYRLYLPREWAEDPTRRQAAKVPIEIEFATKGDLALVQIETALAAGRPRGIVLADAAYGD